MRKIDEIIIHCSATHEGVAFDEKDIDRWHRARGFNCIGYHYVILLDGSVRKGRDVAQVGAHCLGHNSHSIGICYIGGLDKAGRPKDTRTPEQREAMHRLVDDLRKRFGNLPVHGHNEYAAKACPCFKVAPEFA